MDARVRPRGEPVTREPLLMAKARASLASVYGFSAFRPGQEDILAATLEGEDVLAVTPTGILHSSSRAAPNLT